MHIHSLIMKSNIKSENHPLLFLLLNSASTYQTQQGYLAKQSEIKQMNKVFS